MAERRRCASCGRPIPEGKGLVPSVWSDEDVKTYVCSPACKESYEQGLEGRAAPPEPERPTAVVVVLALNAASELTRAVLSAFWSDPLEMVIPLPIRVASAAILAVLAVSIARGRVAGAKAALAIGALTAIAHVTIAWASRSALPLLVPVSLLLPLLFLIGAPARARKAAAFACAAILPLVLTYMTAVRLQQREASLARIERVSLPGTTARSEAGGVRLELIEGWRALRPGNGIVDWAHSELELIQPSTGAAAFVALNPECDRSALTTFQELSLEALDEAVEEPTIIGMVRLSDRLVELRLRFRLGSLLLQSVDLFRELPPRTGGGEGEPPGCVWLHCLAPPGQERAVRSDCRELVGRIERNDEGI